MMRLPDVRATQMTIELPAATRDFRRYRRPGSGMRKHLPLRRFVHRRAAGALYRLHRPHFLESRFGHGLRVLR
ncbi:hypothetical protein I545_2046 [Mycobacterium kansasii 662]|uniref:Uncharacterized protein n=2 Tax=Mycobacterium kansasii TaxID=1768 RepID=A0A1V3XIY3_MYCKA|nr:hypothetical protein I545_2046 [Mycobacterium kansasii 662]OOK79164.1 hypothetical protein BZL30_2241 [Mycobacterium kansasii]OOK79990.1 hypothetical protein BZL29_2234 [Mycobacterium kansasii]